MTPAELAKLICDELDQDSSLYIDHDDDLHYVVIDGTVDVLKLSEVIISKLQIGK